MVAHHRFRIRHAGFLVVVVGLLAAGWVCAPTWSAAARPPVLAPATDEDLDPNFGNGGKTLVHDSSQYGAVHHLAVQPDGKILISTERGQLIRYLPGGTPDSTFGTAGVINTTISAGAGFMDLAPDNKIVDGGGSGGAFIVERRLADGTLDPTFGIGGVNNTPFGTGTSPSMAGLVVLPDKSIIAVGEYADSTYARTGVMVHYSADGRQAAIHRLPTGDSQYNAIYRRPDGAFAVAGLVPAGTDAQQLLLERYNADGTLDSTFAADADSPALTNLVLQPDGSIIGLHSPFLVRWNADGSRDFSFGTTGWSRVLFLPGFDLYTTADALTGTPDGKITVGGAIYYGAGGLPLIGVARYLPDGQPDLAFAGTGAVTTHLSDNGTLTAIMVQPDGRILAGGYLGWWPSGVVALVRYLNSPYTTPTPTATPTAPWVNEDLDPTFGTGGLVTDTLPATNLVLQPDGKFLLTGEQLRRYLPDGQRDPQFGTSGVVSETLPYATLQSSGAIVSGGSVYADDGTYSFWFKLTHHLADGSLDPTFGTGGVVTTSFGSGIVAGFEGLTTLADDSLIVVGQLDSTFTTNCIGRVLIHYSANGQQMLSPLPDTPAPKAFCTHRSYYNGLYRRPDGVFVVFGYEQDDQNPALTHLILTRYGADGTPQQDYNGTTILFSPYAAALFPDGSAVAFALDGYLVRWQANGQVDQSFGTAGRMPITQIHYPDWQPPGLDVTADGKIVLAGYLDSAATRRIALVRYLPDGRLDLSFGGTGVVLTQVRDYAIGSRLRVQPDGKLLLSGWAGGWSTPDQVLVLARYNGATYPTATPTQTATPMPPTATATACAVQFSDVTDPNAYYYQPVYYLACHGVVSGYGDGTYRPFTTTTRGQLAKIVTLAFALPLQTPAAGGYSFTDVPPGSTFFPYVETAVAHRVVSGYGCGTRPDEPCDSQYRSYYRPGVAVTRGQLTKFVVQAAHWSVWAATDETFSDVPGNSTFYPYIQTAACRGIVGGYSDGTFRPGDPAYRAQIAKIVTRAVTQPGTCQFAP